MESIRPRSALASPLRKTIYQTWKPLAEWSVWRRAKIKACERSSQLNNINFVARAKVACRNIYMNAIVSAYVLGILHSATTRISSHLSYFIDDTGRSAGNNEKIVHGLCMNCISEFLCVLRVINHLSDWFYWRRVRESNSCTRICNPLHNHSTNSPPG